MTRPKVIFVDWDGTLSHSRFWEDCPEDIFRPAVIEQITTFLFRDSQELVQRWMRGFTTSTEVTDLLAHRFGLDAPALRRDLERSCRAMQFVDSAVPAKLQKIREHGTKVVIATDNMDTFIHWTAPALQLESLFDGILTSCDRGVFKKEIADGKSQFFDQYLRQQGIHPTEAILLDDSTNNAVVTSLGMQFTHITPMNPLSRVLDMFITS